jgi:hypothetical protein
MKWDSNVNPLELRKANIEAKFARDQANLWVESGNINKKKANLFNDKAIQENRFERH